MSDRCVMSETTETVSELNDALPATPRRRGRPPNKPPKVELGSEVEGDVPSTDVSQEDPPVFVERGSDVDLASVEYPEWAQLLPAQVSADPWGDMPLQMRG